MIYNVENLSKNREWCDKESELKRSIEEYEIVLKKADLTKSEVRKLVFELGILKSRLAYMTEIESLVSETLMMYGITKKVRLCKSDKTEVGLNLKTGGYDLCIRLFEDGDIRSPKVKGRVATHIGHEMSHIVNGDVKNYTFGRGMVEIKRELNKNKDNYSLSYRVGIALVVLYECRADIFGCKTATLLGHTYSSDWIRGDKSYMKTGYLPALARKVILDHFKEYNYNLVDYIFNFYFEKDGFITRKEVNDFIQKSPNKKFRDWATSLMNGYSA